MADNRLVLGSAKKINLILELQEVKGRINIHVDAILNQPALLARITKEASGDPVKTSETLLDFVLINLQEEYSKRKEKRKATIAAYIVRAEGFKPSPENKPDYNTLDDLTKEGEFSREEALGEIAIKLQERGIVTAPAASQDRVGTVPDIAGPTAGDIHLGRPPKPTAAPKGKAPQKTPDEVEPEVVEQEEEPAPPSKYKSPKERGVSKPTIVGAAAGTAAAIGALGTAGYFAFKPAKPGKAEVVESKPVNPNDKPTPGTNPKEPPKPATYVKDASGAIASGAGSTPAAPTTTTPPAPFAPVAPVKPVVPVPEVLPIAPAPRKLKEPALWNFTQAELNQYTKDYILPILSDMDGVPKEFVGEEKKWDRISAIYMQPVENFDKNGKRIAEKEGKDNNGFILLVKRTEKDGLVTESFLPVHLKTNQDIAYTTIDDKISFSSPGDNLAGVLEVGPNKRFMTSIPAAKLKSLGLALDLGQIKDADKREKALSVLGARNVDADGNPPANLQRTVIHLNGVLQGATKHIDPNLAVQAQYVDVPMADLAAHKIDLADLPMVSMQLGDATEKTKFPKMEFGDEKDGQSVFDVRAKGSMALTTTATQFQNLDKNQVVGGDAFNPASIQTLGASFIAQKLVMQKNGTIAAIPVKLFVGAAVKTDKIAKGSQNKDIAGKAEPARIYMKVTQILDAEGKTHELKSTFRTGGANYDDLQKNTITLGGKFNNPQNNPVVVTDTSDEFLKAATFALAKMHQRSWLVGAKGDMIPSETAHKLALDKTYEGKPMFRFMGALGVKQVEEFDTHTLRIQALKHRPKLQVEPFNNGPIKRFAPLAMGHVDDQAQQMVSATSELEETVDILNERTPKMNIGKKNPIKAFAQQIGKEGAKRKEDLERIKEEDRVARSKGRTGPYRG